MSEPRGASVRAWSSRDVPALLDQVIGATTPRADFAVTQPMANRTGLAHALARGGRIAPFCGKVPASRADLRLDRCVRTSPRLVL